VMKLFNTQDSARNGSQVVLATDCKLFLQLTEIGRPRRCAEPGHGLGPQSSVELEFEQFYESRSRWLIKVFRTAVGRSAVRWGRGAGGPGSVVRAPARREGVGGCCGEPEPGACKVRIWPVKSAGIWPVKSASGL
jgi:hypothetical protein